MNNATRRKIAQSLLQAAKALEGSTLGDLHHYFDGKNWHVDSTFLNGLRKAWPEAYEGLKHLGFGEFEVKFADGGVIDFDRLRGKPFETADGRSYQVTDNAGGKLVKELISRAEKTGVSKPLGT